MLGRYRLLERLGRGGFGEVWRAHDELLHREVALKRIWLGPEGDSERATREALAAARLSHPAIVALYEACAIDDCFYLISELVDGWTLAQLISARELADGHALEIGAALADALAHAHARGVIHRDIKPQNVLVPHDADGSGAAAKLTDFGGASIVGEDALTHTGDVLGTLAYMAPEQSEAGTVGVETDLYALALVLYEALSGVNPVRGPTPAATARRIGARHEPLARRRRDLPRELTCALDSAIAPDPQQRGTLGALREALDEALEQTPVEAFEHPREQTLEDALDRLRPRRRLAGTAREHTQGAARRPLPGERHLARADAADPQVAARHAQAEQQQAPQAARTLPRRAWIAAVLALAIWQAASGRAGLALLLLAAAAPVLVLAPRTRARGISPVWLTCAAAPVLGLASLAGAFPALAGQARRWRERAALAALAYWWLTLAEPLLGRHLWLAAAAGQPPRSQWEGSLTLTATHVLGPLLGLGVLLGAALWAAGAVTLPWVVRGRSAPFDIVGAVVWTSALAAAAPMFDAGLSAGAAHPSPRGVVLGAIAAALVAIAARALRGPV